MFIDGRPNRGAAFSSGIGPVQLFRLVQVVRLVRK